MKTLANIAKLTAAGVATAILLHTVISGLLFTSPATVLGLLMVGFGFYLETRKRLLRPTTVKA